MPYTLPSAFSKRAPGPGLAVAMGDRLALPTLSAQLEIEDDDQRIVRARITTPDLDRDGDILEPEGCRKRLANYLRNPIVCWNHDRDDIPLGTDLGNWEITPGGIVARCQFSKSPRNKRALDVYDAVKEGTVRAVSVSFIPHQHEHIRGQAGRYRITDWEPLEWSFAPIPSNPFTGVLPPSKGMQYRGAILKSLGIKNVTDDSGHQHDTGGLFTGGGGGGKEKPKPSAGQEAPNPGKPEVPEAVLRNPSMAHIRRFAESQGGTLQSEGKDWHVVIAPPGLRWVVSGERTVRIPLSDVRTQKERKGLLQWAMQCVAGGLEKDEDGKKASKVINPKGRPLIDVLFEDERPPDGKKVLPKSLGMSEADGSGGGFMADTDDDKPKPESADKKFCKAMKKAVDDHEPVAENEEVKKFVAKIKKHGGGHFSKAYPDEDWGWQEQEQEGEGKESEGDEPGDDDEVSDEEQKSFEALASEFYGLTGRKI